MQKLSFKGCCIGSFCSLALKTELVVISTKKCYFCCPATKLLLHYWEEEQNAISLQQCTIHLMQINVKKQIQLSGIYLCNNYVSFNWGKVSWIVLQSALFLKVIDWLWLRFSFYGQPVYVLLLRSVPVYPALFEWHFIKLKGKENK